jgi:penicillin-binding protein 2B
MKIFTLAAAVEEGVYNGEEKYHSGTYKVGKSKIGDHNNGEGWGEITFNEGVERSSNVAFAILANEKLGANRFNQYLHKFGFYDKTGVDIPGEASGNINFKYDIEKVTTAFGQGSSITPIQQLQAATAIANNGKMMKPYVIDHITDPNKKNKTVLQNSPESAGQPISANTSKQVRDILEKVVTSKNGTGKPYKIEGFDIAGKTGTAQMAGADGKLLTGRENYVFSFLGMAPKDDPELVVYVAVQQPQLKDTETGSAPVSSIFKPVMENSLHYLNIKPKEKASGDKASENMPSASLSDLTGMRMEMAEKQAKDEGFTPVKIGDGAAVQKQYPESGNNILPNEKVFLASEGQVKMPDMTGWSRRDVLNYSHLTGIHFELNGKGFATKQSVKKGKEINGKTTVKIEFNNPD